MQYFGAFLMSSEEVRKKLKYLRGRVIFGVEKGMWHP
jgi:hypothetical protein